MRDPRDDWRRFAAAAIPSKESTPNLDSFLHEVTTAAAGRPLALLDVGCGSGRLSPRLFEQGFVVLGVDINADAIHAAQHRAASADSVGRSLRFEVADLRATYLPLAKRPRRRGMGGPEAFTKTMVQVGNLHLHGSENQCYGSGCFSKKLQMMAFASSDGTAGPSRNESGVRPGQTWPPPSMR